MSAGRARTRSARSPTARCAGSAPSGYPFATAATLARVDSAANRADLAVQVDPGQRARVRRIVVIGNETIPQREIVRQLSVKAGRLV